MPIFAINGGAETNVTIEGLICDIKKNNAEIEIKSLLNNNSLVEEVYCALQSLQNTGKGNVIVLFGAGLSSMYAKKLERDLHEYVKLR
jgi:hypothetical protein